MKILYTHRIASKDGQYVHVKELTDALLEQGHELVWVTPTIQEDSGFGSEAGIVDKLKAKLPGWVYELLELGYSLLTFWNLALTILKEKPDVIYERYNLYSPAGIVASKLFKLPLLLEVNAPLYEERKKYSGIAIDWLAKRVEHFTWKHASVTLPVTDVLANSLRDAGVPETRIEVVHNGINQNVFEEIKAYQRPVSSTINIGFVGFLNKWHNLDMALEAIREVADYPVMFTCIGDGNDNIREHLEDKAKNLGISDKVNFTGLLNRDEVFQYTRDFDISLQPAVTPYASPLKMFEYMAVASLVIAPNSDNILEILSDKSALLFENGNFDDFKNKLIHAITHLQELQPLRDQIRADIDIKKFTWQDNAKRVVHLAQRLQNERA